MKSLRHQSGKRTSRSEVTDALYKHPLRSLRSGPVFSAFPYPTKISPEAIALFIACHTEPGDTVFDGFAGSGTTGVAALLCGAPSDEMRDQAKRLKLNVKWGARKAVLNDISVLGSTIAGTLCNPPDPDAFRKEAERILESCESELGWMYEARDPEGNLGTVRYVIWSEVVECPNCAKHVTVWDGCVRRNPARINPKLRCPDCARSTPASEARRVLKIVTDRITNEPIKTRVRQAVWLYGSTGKRDWNRPIEASDRLLWKRIGQMKPPAGVPRVKIPWGDLYRSGYHQGITYLHHFYTQRNLAVFASLWERVEVSPLRDALRAWLLSYNASHATLMTRVVAKQGQRDLVVTSNQPGVLYISGLPVEKNLFSGLRRKLGTISAAFAVTHKARGAVDVRRGSCLQTRLPANSVDYVFTDPPFGGNIPYAEVNFINEAWLGVCTNAAEEITINRSQGRAAADYESLMRAAFRELHRILKPDGKATVVFHSSSSGLWNALNRAYSDAGLQLEAASVLNKTQGSFKQVTAPGAVKGDPVLLLRKGLSKTKHAEEPVGRVLDDLVRRAHASGDLAEATVQRLYSRFVNYYLSQQHDVPLDANEFYAQINTRLGNGTRGSRNARRVAD